MYPLFARWLPGERRFQLALFLTYIYRRRIRFSHAHNPSRRGGVSR